MTNYTFLRTRRMSWRGKIGLIGVGWLTAVFRFHGLFANRFHADEALFATWARLIAVWRDPLLLTQAVDKPPLLFYLQALFYPLQGPVAWAARLPNFIASILLVPLLGMLVWRWYGDEKTAVLAAFFLALSPFAIQFSATAFTDPLLVMWLVAALVVASSSRIKPQSNKQRQVFEINKRNWLSWHHAYARRDILQTFVVRKRYLRSFVHSLNPAQLAQCAGRCPTFTEGRLALAGVLFGLALATKYQAWLFLPLLVGAAWLAGWRWRDGLRFVGGLLAVFSMVLLWDFVRTGQFSLWGAQMGNFGGIRLSWSWEIWPRLHAWVQMWRWLWVSPVVMGFMAVAVGWPLVCILCAMFRKLCFNRLPLAAHRARITDLLDQMLALFIFGYALVHWLLAVPVWDRYLLALAPLLAILGARLMVNGSLFIVKTPGRRSGAWLVGGVLLLVLLTAAWQGRNGRFPVGGGSGADGGAAEIAAYLYDAPYGTVLYDHWFSWQWNYYLFDRGVYVNWVPQPAMLVEDLTVFSGDDTLRFIVLPDDGSERPFMREVEAAGFSLTPIPEAGGARMVLYQIE
ncbi:MAG: hypothetical protein CSB13_04055 [Chloroflexi bacterium]|nr:MAG: hypothetical protein CSB13_04055 [Chloroflexota bacterium]